MQLKQALSKLILVVLWVAVLGSSSKWKLVQLLSEGTCSFGTIGAWGLVGIKRTESNKDLHTFLNLPWIFLYSPGLHLSDVAH